MKAILMMSVLAVSSLFTKLPAQHTHTSHDSLSEVIRTVVRKQVLSEKGLDNREVQMVIVDFPPNSAVPAHRHPCPTFGYVLEGEIESVFEGKTYVYKKGDSFYEKTNGLHFAASNKSQTVPAKLLVFYIAEEGKPTAIPEK